MREDNIGLAVIATLDRLLAEREYTLTRGGKTVSVRLYSANQDPVLAGAIIAEGQPVLIIDAVDMKLPPGSIKVFSLDEAILSFVHRATSTHGFDLAQILKLVEELGYKSNVRIIGIQIDKDRLELRKKNSPVNKAEEIIGEGLVNKIISKILEEVKQIA